MRILITSLLTGLYCSISLAATPELIFASDLIRHGARTVIHPIKGVDYPPLWSEQDIPPGQLTKYGFFEEKSNGMFFKQTYTELLPKHYDSKQICVRTDGVNRTIMSALAVMSQMYPQSLSYLINSVPKSTDRLVQPKKNLNNLVAQAPGWQTAWQQAKFGHDFYQQLYQKKLIPDLCPTSGKQNYMNCFKKIGYIASSVLPLKSYCSHADASCKTTEILNIDKKLMHQIIQTNNWVKQHAFLPSHQKGFIEALNSYQQLGLQSGCILVSEVAHNMQVKINGNTDTTFILYSGHDSTLLTVMNYLMSQNFAAFKQSPIYGNPQFAADLSFRLYKTGKDHYQVKVIYRNNWKADTKQQTIFKGPFPQFKQLYSNKQCLTKIESYKRCDYL